MDDHVARRACGTPTWADSYQRLCHDSGEKRFLLDLRPGHHEPLRRRLAQPRLERFIGVIYSPETELWSHYSQAILPEQFDAYVWFDEPTRSSRSGHFKDEPPAPD